MLIVYQSPDAATSIEWHPEAGYLLVRLSGRVSHADYRATYERLFEAVGTYQCRNVVFNLRQLTHAEVQSRAWFNTQLFPKIIRTYGLRFHAAIVQPENQTESRQVRFLTRVGSGLGFTEKISFFDNLDSAVAWMAQKQKIQ